MKQGFMPSTNLTLGGKGGIIEVYITVCWLSEKEVTMKRQPDKKIYLYGRLSHEDELQGDSNSVISGKSSPNTPRKTASHLTGSFMMMVFPGPILTALLFSK